MNRRSFVTVSTAALAGPLLRIEAHAQAAPSSAGAAKPAPTGRRFRQIHLDFHTSELITDVAADFRPADFLRTLQEAQVNSINLFAKCHHGWAYYDTKVAHKHPHLHIDLLRQQVDVLRPAGIEVNYYYSLVWDNRSAKATPQWRARNKDGSGLYQGYWPWMCMNTPYLDQVMAENAEILDLMQFDGAMWDILIQPPHGCYCAWCVADRKRLGLSDSPEDIYRQNKMVALRTEQSLFVLVKSKQPQATTFFNSRLVVGINDELPYYSDLLIESLPTGGWGYTHFEHRVRYCHTLGKPIGGITGRFHKSWGDFGGFKPQAALDFECMNFLANGATACVGDQLHPRGALDPVTYRLIGHTYQRVAQQEHLLNGMRSVADIGVVSTLATAPSMAVQGLPPSEQGFTNMLVELHHQFDVLDLNADFGRYKLIILPDEVLPIPSLVEKIQDYVARGGALLVTYKSLLNEAGTTFAIKEIGVCPLGPSKFKGEYILPLRPFFPSVDQDAYYLYQQGLAIEVSPGTQTLATYGHPYFDRSPEHWCSHAQTPFAHATEESVVTRARNIIYCANPIFASYALDGELVFKMLTKDLIAACLPRPAVRASGVPSTARLTIMEDPVNHNQLLQVLYAPYERRAPNIDIIEEEASFLRASVEIRRSGPPAHIAVMDEHGRVSDLHFKYIDGYVHLRLPRVTGQIAVLIT